jgi:hypothetical protein
VGWSLSRRRWFALGLAWLSLIYLTLPVAGQTLPEPPDPSAYETIADFERDGWTWSRTLPPVLSVHLHPTVGTTQQTRILQAVATAGLRVPAVFGGAEAPVHVYVLPDRQSLGLALGEAGLAASDWQPGVYAWTITGGQSPGIYLDASAFSYQGGAVWAVAHELTHLLVRRAVGGIGRLPTWFDEGLAEYLAAQVVEASEPRYAALRRFTNEGRWTAASQHGLIPGLDELATPSGWRLQTSYGVPVYETAQLAVAQLLADGRASQLPTLFNQIAAGQSFAESVRATWSSTEELAALSTLGPSLPSRAGVAYPPGLSSDRQSLRGDEFAAFVWVGATPGERITWLAEGPGGCGGVAVTTSADAVGFDHYVFTVDPTGYASCAGSWRMTARTASGATASLDFTLHPTEIVP